MLSNFLNEVLELFVLCNEVSFTIYFYSNSN